jgi:transformation/transcription domain-associated protein
MLTFGFNQLLEPCFNSKLPDIGKSLCTLLKMVFDAFPVESPNIPQDIRPIHAKVEDLIQKHLATVTNIQPSLDTSTANAMIGFTWSIVKTLTEGQKRYIDWFLPALVRVIQRLMKEMISAANALSKQVSTMQRKKFHHLILL